MNHPFRSSAIIGFALFAALSVFSFQFQAGMSVFFLETGHEKVVGGLLALVFLLLLVFPDAVQGRRRIGLGMLYLFIPFTFGIYSGQRWSFFLFPAHPVIAAEALAIAALLLGRAALAARRDGR